MAKLKKDELLQIDIGMYETNVICIFSLKTLMEFGKEHDLDFAAPSEYGATTYSLSSGSQIIYFNSVTPGIVAHECVHAAHGIMGSRGCIADFVNDESEAYLVGYLVEVINQYVTVKPRKNYKW